MVSDDTHRYVHLLVLTILLPAERLDSTYQRGEEVGVVVGLLTLHSHTETLEAHARIDHLVR